MIDWATLHATTWVHEPQCWTLCGDGFCCTFNRPGMDFRFFPKGLSNIFYLGDEYDWLKARGLAATAGVKAMMLDFGRGPPLRIVQASCTHGGHCAGKIERPLLCKLYPFLPVFDDRDELVDLAPASLLDATMVALKIPLPCVIWERKKQAYLQRYKDSDTIRLLLQPGLRLYAEAASLLFDAYARTLADWAASLAHGPLALQPGSTPFWQEWEMAYFRGKLIDMASVKANLAGRYDRLQAAPAG